jgi:O-antigen/teichoic acid export membrane protein
MKDLIIIYFERFIHVLFVFFINYFVINYFTQNDYGLYKYIVSIVSAAGIFSLLGFNIANIRYIPEYLENKEYFKIKYQIFIFSVIQLTLICASLLLFYFFLNNDIVVLDENIDVVLLSSLFLLSYVKSYFAESLLVAFSKRVLLTYARIALYFIQFSIIYIAIASKVNIREFIEYIVVFSIIETLLLVFVAFKVYRDKVIDSNLTKFNLTDRYIFSINNYGFSVVNFLRDNAVTIIVVSYLFNYKEVAYYSLALMIPNIVRGFTPSKVFAGFLIPDLVDKFNEKHDKLDVFKWINFMSKIDVIFLIPAIIYSLFLYDLVISNVFNEEYAKETFTTSVALFMNVFFLSLLGLNAILTTITKESNLLFKVNLLSISNIFLLFLLSDFGRVSIGIANLLSTFLVVISFWFVFRKKYNTAINFNFFNKINLLYFVALCVISLALYNINIFLYMILFPFIVIFLWIGMLKTSYFSKLERHFIFTKIITNKKLKYLLYE